jgi:hypothetical protein
MSIAELRRQLEQMEAPGPAAGSVLPFGLPELDVHFLNGSLALGHLHEVIEGGPVNTPVSRHVHRRHPRANSRSCVVVPVAIGRIGPRKRVGRYRF